MNQTTDTPTDKTLKQEITFNQDRIAIISNLELHLSDEQQSGQRITGCATLLCTKGKSRLMHNCRELSFEEGDLLVCAPGDYLESVGLSDDFNTCGFYLTEQFFKEISNIPLGFVNARVYISEHPVMHINERAAEVFKQYYKLIRSKLNIDTPVKHHKLIIDLLLEAFIYEFHDTLENTLEAQPMHFTSGDNLYKDFLNLIFSSYPKPRSVVWYANKLNVTPKYLSSVTKIQGGETASTIINRYVLEDVKRNLMRPEKTIKEIVCELNFPSISFFGKYVKKHLGLAPKYYRRQILEEL